MKPKIMNVMKKSVNFVLLGIWNPHDSGLNRMFMQKRSATKYRTMTVANNDVNPKFCMIKPPVAGPIMLAMDGMTTEKRLIVRARTFDSLSLNWRRLKLGQKVAVLSP
jgi:hypothetical protein